MTTSYHDPSELIFIQSRAEIHPALVEEYAEMMRDGVGFDPADAISDGVKIYVWDGFHRGEAASQAGKLLFVTVKPGTREEAEWNALTKANKKHGKQLGPADKRKIVRLALLHPNGAGKSDRQIALDCQVSHTFAGNIRKELELTGNVYSQPERTGSDGRTISVANIGSNQPGYASIPALEQGVRRWLDSYSDLAGRLRALGLIKARTAHGVDLLERLLFSDALPGPRRKGDVVQAVHNVLDQLQQQQRGESNSEEIAELLEAARIEGLDLAGYHYCPNCTKRNVDIFPLLAPNTKIKCLYCQRQYKTVAEVRAFLDYQVEAMANAEKIRAEMEARRKELPNNYPDGFPETPPVQADDGEAPPAPAAKIPCYKCEGVLDGEVILLPASDGLACSRCGSVWESPEDFEVSKAEAARRLAEMQVQIQEANSATYRQTPPGQPTVADLAPVGQYMISNYTEEYSGWGKIISCGKYETEGHSAFTLAYVSPGVKPRKDGTYSGPSGWINDLVAVDGRIKKLHTTNTDEVRIFPDEQTIRVYLELRKRALESLKRLLWRTDRPEELVNLLANEEQARTEREAEPMPAIEETN